MPIFGRVNVYIFLFINLLFNVIEFFLKKKEPSQVYDFLFKKMEMRKMHAKCFKSVIQLIRL